MWVAMLVRDGHTYAEAAGTGKTEEEAIEAAMTEAASQISGLDGEDPRELLEQDLDEGNIALYITELG